MDKVSLSELEAFQRKNPKLAPRILSALGKNRDFMQAVESPLGQELLSDLLGRMEGLLEKIIMETATPEDRAEYRVCRKLSMDWSSRIQNYRNNIHTIQKASQKEEAQ